MWIGWKHDNTRLPLALPEVGGTLKTGRTLDYGQAGDDNRRCQSVPLDMDRWSEARQLW
jgi:hypothetical protein